MGGNLTKLCVFTYAFFFFNCVSSLRQGEILKANRQQSESTVASSVQPDSFCRAPGRRETGSPVHLSHGTSPLRSLRHAHLCVDGAAPTGVHRQRAQVVLIPGTPNISQPWRTRRVRELVPSPLPQPPLYPKFKDRVISLESPWRKVHQHPG